ncbi:hypothetical protein [Tenacibaculum phage JQ]|nr:hypothetical protein [Tenacibaculum phage JQ]
MNSYKTSTGERIKQSVIDRLVRKAKEQKLMQQFDEHGYNFCEKCGVSNGTYLDCSHDISVNDCKKQGKTELAFDVNNISVKCRTCHQKKDKLNLHWK